MGCTALHRWPFCTRCCNSATRPHHAHWTGNSGEGRSRRGMDPVAPAHDRSFALFYKGLPLPKSGSICLRRCMGGFRAEAGVSQNKFYLPPVRPQVAPYTDRHSMCLFWHNCISEELEDRTGLFKDAFWMQPNWILSLASLEVLHKSCN